MSKIVFILLLLSSFVFPGYKVIKNPGTPLNPNHGRIVKLKEVMRITDESGNFYFRFPGNITVTSRHIYTTDRIQFLIFDDKGNFIRNIYKKGQGPREMDYAVNYIAAPEELIVQAWSPPKIIYYSIDGIYKEEKRTEHLGLYDFAGFNNNMILGLNMNSQKNPSTTKGFTDYPLVLYEISRDFKTIKKKFSFPMNTYFERNTYEPRAVFYYTRPASPVLFIIHSEEYKIVKFDLQNHEINTVFSREYQRVKKPKEKQRKPRPAGVFDPPPHIYYQDAYSMLIMGDKLWVFTSCKNKDNHPLVDVFSMTGKYVDRFYLCPPAGITLRFKRRGSILAHDGYIYAVIRDEDENPCIIKCAVSDNENSI